MCQGGPAEAFCTFSSKSSALGPAMLATVICRTQCNINTLMLSVPSSDCLAFSIVILQTKYNR